MSYIEPPIIDSHVHIFTSRTPYVETAWTRPDYDYSAEDYIGDMDRFGVSFGVIAAVSLHGENSDYVLDSLARYKRLRATVRIPPDTDRYTLRRMADQGVVGIRFQWGGGDPPDFTSPQYRTLLNRLVDVGMHVQINASGAKLAQVLPAIEASGVRIVVDHFGLLRAPDGLASEGFAALGRAVQRGSAWVKISGAIRLKPELVQAYTDAVLAFGGPERVFWGSDAPFVGHEATSSYEGALNIFYRTVPDPAVRRAISDAALKFYFF